MSESEKSHLSEESKKFFLFFNISLLLVAVTGIEVVIIYIRTFSPATIFAVLAIASIIKFVAVIWWFMHLKWDKIFLTLVFISGLIVAVATFAFLQFIMIGHVKHVEAPEEEPIAQVSN